MLELSVNTSYQGVVGDFSLKDLEGFPYQVWEELQDEYRELEDWYSGDALKDDRPGSSEDLYPIRINPLKSACQKHVAALFGEFPDSGDFIPVRVRVKPATDNESEAATSLERVLELVYSESNSQSKMIENGLLSQIFGGCIFRLAWDPGNSQLSTGIRVDTIHPKHFMGIPDRDDPWNLREAWVIKRITYEEALSYGVELPATGGWYVEHWTRTDYEIMINNVVIGFSVYGEEYSARGANPFGFVPFVYIPHVRAAAEFWGESVITDAAKGLTRELNARAADAGDASSDDSHGYVTMVNVRGMPSVVEIADGLPAINLGSAQQMMSGDSKPSLTPLKKSIISAPMVQLVETIYSFIRREVNLPAVAEGEDEGSQRSSATLFARMWHLTSHIKLERVWWSVGLQVLSKMATRMMASKGVSNVTEEHTKMRFNVQWASMLPRDRTELINELSVRAANNLGSLEHLIELTGDVDDEEQEMEKIKEWIKFNAETKSAGVMGQGANLPNQKIGKNPSMAPKKGE